MSLAQLMNADQYSILWPFIQKIGDALILVNDLSWKKAYKPCDIKWWSSPFSMEKMKNMYMNLRLDNILALKMYLNFTN